MLYPALLPLMPHTSAASSRLNWRPPADLNGLANAVGSQYPSHYLGTWCIQHYYRWCRTPRLPVFDWTDAHRPILLDSSVSPKEEIWFLRVRHHISTGLYYILSYYLIIFGEQLLNLKCVFWFPSQMLPPTLKILTSIQRDINVTACRCSCKVLIFFSDF